MITELFMKILDMSITASVVILLVILARVCLKKMPRVISYALWAVVLFRLLCPVTLELPVSAVPEITPVKDSYALADIQLPSAEAGAAAYKAVDNAINGINGTENQLVPITKPDSIGKTTYIRLKWTDIAVIFGQYVWLLGMVAMAVYSVISYWKLRRQMAVRIKLEEGVFICDDIGSPFVMGIVRPTVYLPSGIDPKERNYILAHERHHIRRMDPLWKLLAYAALTLHWFNPLVWVVFILACKDMEMSCDEAVIRQMGSEVRAEYAASLATMATGKRIIAGTPLAFAEGDPKSRIRNLAKWKKPVVWVVVMSVILSVVLAGCLLVDPVKTDTKPTVPTEPADTSTQPTEAIADIRPLPPKNPGSSLIDYDPNRQIYIASENIYVDFYVGITAAPSFNISIYSKEPVDPDDISIEFPVDLPFVINIDELKIPRTTEYKARSGEHFAMPYYVYYAYRGGDFAEFETNTRLEEDFQSLSSEDVPEFYLYHISVAFVNILELDAPVTVKKADITFGGQVYEAKFGRVRVFPKEAFPSDAQVVRRGQGLIGNSVQLYNDGLVRLHALEMENVPENMTVTGLWMLNEETQILDISAVITSGGKTVEMKWDGKTPIYLYKGDTVYIYAMIRNELTGKLLNSVHLQAAVEYTLEETGETVCRVNTTLGTQDRHPYEYYAIVFDGVDMESYYRDYFYKNSFGWLNPYREQ